MSIVDVQTAIKARLAEKAMDADEVLARLADQARGTMEDFLVFKEGFRGMAAVDLDQARERGKLHLIKKYSVAKDEARVELYDAQAALSLLGKHLGLFVERREISGRISGSFALEEIPVEDLGRLAEACRRLAEAGEVETGDG